MRRPSFCIVFARVNGKDVYFNEDGTYQGNPDKAKLMEDDKAVALIERLATLGINATYDDRDHFFGD